MKRPILLSVQVAMPHDIDSGAAGDPSGTPWRSGFLKQPVGGPVFVGRMTVRGDGQADLSVHGGPDRPVLAYCAEHYDLWKAELGLTTMPFGGFGENFTICGLDERTTCLGDRYAIGGLRVEASQPRQPCWKLARRWNDKSLPARVIEHDRGGWYFRVLEEGEVEAGMAVELLERPYPKWTIARANHAMYHGNDDVDALRELASLPPLSADWRKHFGRRTSALAE
jgi:MOSC domain-containing protein YiiM